MNAKAVLICAVGMAAELQGRRVTRRQLRQWLFRRALGHHVDRATNGAERLHAVQQGAWPLQHLDALGELGHDRIGRQHAVKAAVGRRIAADHEASDVDVVGGDAALGQ